MALIKCSECGADVSSRAPACTRCGAPSAEGSHALAPVERAHTKAQGEDLIYRTDGVTITSTRLVFGATVYPTRNVTSVRAQQTLNEPLRLLTAVGLCAVAALSLLFSPILFFASGLSDAALAILIAGGCLLIMRLLGGMKTEYLYQVILVTSSGQSVVYASTNQSSAARIVSSINQSIASC